MNDQNNTSGVQKPYSDLQGEAIDDSAHFLLQWNKISLDTSLDANLLSAPANMLPLAC